MTIKSNITNKYGESYLQDANYIVFFVKSTGWTSSDKKKLFELTNRALGKDANGMTESDFKELALTQPSVPDEENAETDTDASTSQSDVARTLFMKITIK